MLCQGLRECTAKEHGNVAELRLCPQPARPLLVQEEGKAGDQQ